MSKKPKEQTMYGVYDQEGKLHAVMNTDAKAKGYAKLGGRKVMPVTITPKNNVDERTT